MSTNQESASTTTVTSVSDKSTSAMGVLTAGLESAIELRAYMLHETRSDDGALGLHIIPQLLEKIISSFDEAKTVLNRGDRSEEVSPKTEDSGESSKHSPLAVRKGRRGCYKRRKGSQSWTRVVPTVADDGHAWRKYGQKAILNAPYPRSYFRCTHKKEQNCPATKQVQMSQSDPPMHTITYDGNHTCSNLLNSQTLFVDSAPAAAAAGAATESCSLMLSFDSAAAEPNKNHQSLLFVGSPPPSSSDDMFSQADFLAFEGLASNEYYSNLDRMEFIHHHHHQVGIGMSVEEFDAMKLEFDY